MSAGKCIQKENIRLKSALIGIGGVENALKRKKMRIKNMHYLMGEG
jgi:hypothetical protein